MAEVATHTPVKRARQLRKDGTEAENRLWYVLRNRNFDNLKFVRQMPIGTYFADFACREMALIVELDGGQLAESATDARRTAFLLSQGHSVLRFWNNDVMSNRDGVLETIRNVVAGNPSPDLRYAQATLSPTGRGIRGALAAALRLPLGFQLWHYLFLSPSGRGWIGRRPRRVRGLSAMQRV